VRGETVFDDSEPFVEGETDGPEDEEEFEGVEVGGGVGCGRKEALASSNEHRASEGCGSWDAGVCRDRWREEMREEKAENALV
jgi:hypothetical protein